MNSDRHRGTGLTELGSVHSHSQRDSPPQPLVPKL